MSEARVAELEKTSAREATDDARRASIKIKRRETTSWTTTRLSLAERKEKGPRSGPGARRARTRATESE